MSLENPNRRDVVKGIIGAIATTVLSGGGYAISRKREAPSFEDSPFSPETQKILFQKVAAIMNVPNETIFSLPVPTVMVAEKSSDEEFYAVIGFDTGHARCNLFYPPKTIFLMQNAKIHNLAHEFVHFFQYHHGGVRPENADDQTEIEAVHIQDLFRSGMP